MTSDIQIVQSGSGETAISAGLPFPRLFGDQLTAFLADVKLGLILENNQRRILYANPCLCSLMGISVRPEDLIGGSYGSFAEQSRPLLTDASGFHYRTEGLRRSRLQSQGDLLLFSDGRTLEFDYHPVFLDKEHQGHLWIFRDVTERERVRRDNERFLEVLLRVLPDVVYIFDVAEQKSIYVSPKITTVLGYSSVEVAAMGSDVLSRLINPEDQRLVKAHHAHLREGDGESGEIEYRMFHRDGTLRWFQAHETIFRRDAAGKTDQVLGVAQDITARKALESERDTAVAAQKEAERRLAEVQTVAHVGSWEYDVAGDRIFCSPETFRIFGFNSAENTFDYASLKECLGDEDRVRLEEGMQNALIRRFPYALDLRITKRDGLTKRWVHITATPITAPENPARVTRLVGVIQDIEERHQLEQQSRHADKMQSLGQFAAEITHEINNPIAAISGVAQLLEYHPEPQVAEDGKTIRDMANRAANIVRSLRRFVQEGSAFPASSAHPFIDLNGTVKTSLTLVKRLRGLPAASLEIHLADSLPLIAADASQVEQVVVNLVSNARQAMASRPRSERNLRIETGISDDGQRHLFVRVTDTGPGVPPDLLDRIFAPFFTTKTRSKGMGLGLSICRTIARSHNGEITVESVPGTGSTFTLFLPVAPSIYDNGLL